MKCEDCDHELTSFPEWSKMTPEDRAGKRLQWGPCCRRCYDRRRRPPRTTWPLKDLIEEAEFLFAGGTAVEDVAFRLGIKAESLVRQYKRAKDRGLTDRVLNYRRTK